MAALEGLGSKYDQSPSLELLCDIRTIIESRKIDWIYTADLVKALCEDETKPWAQFSNGASITPRQLAVRLAPYGINSVDIRSGHVVRKGYRAEDFAEIFHRYLPQANLAESVAQHATPEAWSDTERSA
jgi:putative DNA primase/helicase